MSWKFLLILTPVIGINIIYASEFSQLIYNSQSKLPRDPRSQILKNFNLLEMEQLMLGSVPRKDIINADVFLGLKKEQNDHYDEKYKLWEPEFAFRDKIQDPNIKETFQTIQKDFLQWAKNKTSLVEFMMNMPQAGSKDEEPYLFKKGWFDSSPDPKNPRPHYIDHDFYLSDFITQEVWLDVMGENPSYYPNQAPCPGDERTFTKIVPGKRKIKEIKYCKGWAVTNINLYDARKFIHILNMGSAAHIKYDIPNEWQFDFAARGGLSTEIKDNIINTGKFGSLDLSNNDLNEFKKHIPWISYDTNEGQGRTKKLKPFPREFGPHDLIGHLYTWTKSLYDSSNKRFDSHSTKTTPQKYFGLDWNLEDRKSGAGASSRIVRGAFWFSHESYLRAGDDDDVPPTDGYGRLGLRLLRTIHAPQELNP